MDKNKLSGCMIIIIVFAVIMIVGGVLNHVSEQAEKLDWVTDTFIGAIIVGLILAVIHYANKSRNK